MFSSMEERYMLTDTWIAKLFFTVPQKTSLYHLKK